ncbi:MAG: hypothetical protein LBE65_06245, partial [Synergistaceae bacterium]|nr:hypothetical protein [Synergistaceae bacterium]
MSKRSWGLSAVVLILLALLAILGPNVFGLRDGEMAPPYSKPSWMDKSTVSTETLAVKTDASRGEVSFSESVRWNYLPPKRVSFTGRLDFGRIEWTTP